jgi:hypothetical protein
MRRRLIYVLTGILLVTAAVDVFVFRAMLPGDRPVSDLVVAPYRPGLDAEFAWTRPFMIGLETRFYKTGVGYPANEPWKFTRMTLRDVPLKTISDNLQRAHDWKHQWIREGSDRSFTLIHPADIDQTMVVGDAYIEVDWTSQQAVITTDRHLSHSEVTAIKVAHPGGDPFETRPSSLGPI